MIANHARNNEMRRMRYENKLTLQQIANHFGITRERVRQVVGNSAEIRDQVTQERHETIRSSTNLSNSEIQTATGYCNAYISKLRSGTHHAIEPESTSGLGQEAEHYVSNYLTDIGISNELMPIGHSFDILVNRNIRVDVKHTRGTVKTSPGIKSPQYQFQDKKNGSGSDYFVCVIWETKDCYIIPAHRMKRYLYICHPSKRPELAKYADCLNAWDLLK